MPLIKKRCCKEDCQGFFLHYHGSTPTLCDELRLKIHYGATIPSFYYDTEYDQIKEAILHDDLGKCSLLLQSGGEHGNKIITLLFQHAMQCHSYQCMKVINNYRKATLQQWSDHHHHDPVWYGYISILLASSLCHLCKGQILDALLQSDLPDINKPDEKGLYLIHYLCHCKKPEIYLNIFLKNRKRHMLDIYVEKLKPPLRGLSALTLCLNRRYFDQVQTMLENDVDPNLNNSHETDKYYPLHQAIIFLNQEMVNLLLKSGANINQQGRIMTHAWKEVTYSYYPIEFMYCDNYVLLNEREKGKQCRKENILKLMLKQNPLINNRTNKTTDCDCSQQFHLLAHAAGLPGHFYSMTERDMSLRSLCRKTIRNRLAACNARVTIYNSVLQLPLPNCVNNYLLYNVSFDLEV